MATVTNFFLGANSGGGFHSLFHQLTAEAAYDLMILKGCPGCGKSTFMELLGGAMEAAGLDVEYIRCAGDPASLDAVLLPGLGCGVADGTAPHVLEPTYPLAVQRWVDLGRFCEVSAAKAAAADIVRCTDAAKAADIRAGHALLAAGEMEKELRAAAAKGLDGEKFHRRMEGIRSRELRRRGSEGGKRRLRFLGGVSCEGYVWRFDSVEKLCPRVYELADSFGLAGAALESLCTAAEEKGWDTIACLSPEEPQRMEHLLIPGLGLAFVTSRPGMRYPGSPYRRVRVDAMAETENRGKLRFERKLAALLREEALEALGEARRWRREVEALYNPYVDFDGVRALAAVEASRILSWA